MNVNKIVKISSNEGGAFTSQNRRVSFDIPANTGQYDLSSSYIEFNCNVSQANNADNNVAVPVIDFVKEDGATLHKQNLDNVVLVKNISMSCSNKGNIADIRRVDILRNNMKNYLQRTEGYRGKNNQLFVQPMDNSGNVNSIFRELRREGTDISKIVQAPIQIPLSDLVGFGNVSAYDTEKYGRTKINAELNLDKVRVAQARPQATADIACLNLNQNRGSATTSVFITVGGTTEARILRVEDIPVHVGQIINIRATGVGNATAIANAGVDRTITGIVLNRAPFTDADSGTVEIQFTAPLSAAPLGNGDSYNTVRFRGKDNDMTFSCDTADLVLTKLNNPVKVADQLQYTEFSTEEHTAGGVQTFQRQFTVEPEAINLYVMRADEMNSANGDAGISSFRIRVNNEDLVDRDVEYRSPLYYDRISMTFINSQKQIKNLNEQAREIDVANTRATEDYYKQANHQLILIANPIPMTPSDKLVQVNLTSGANAINNINLYKELLKSI